MVTMAVAAPPSRAVKGVPDCLGRDVGVTVNERALRAEWQISCFNEFFNGTVYVITYTVTWPFASGMLGAPTVVVTEEVEGSDRRKEVVLADARCAYILAGTACAVVAMIVARQLEIDNREMVIEQLLGPLKMGGRELDEHALADAKTVGVCCLGGKPVAVVWNVESGVLKIVWGMQDGEDFFHVEGLWTFSGRYKKTVKEVLSINGPSGSDALGLITDRYGAGFRSILKAQARSVVREIAKTHSEFPGLIDAVSSSGLCVI